MLTSEPQQGRVHRWEAECLLLILDSSAFSFPESKQGEAVFWVTFSPDQEATPTEVGFPGSGPLWPMLSTSSCDLHPLPATLLSLRLTGGRGGSPGRGGEEDQGGQRRPEEAGCGLYEWQKLDLHP